MDKKVLRRLLDKKELNFYSQISGKKNWGGAPLPLLGELSPPKPLVQEGLDPLDPLVGPVGSDFNSLAFIQLIKVHKQMATSDGGDKDRKDCFYLETLAMPGEINSMVVGRFFDRNIESLILAKSTFLSIFHNNEKEDSFDFVDHISVFKEVYCLCTSVQPHSLDCLFVLSINGEWLFLQWNKTKFFPLASGSLLKAIQPLMKTPELRRFRLDPTFQWAVSVVPISDNSPRFFTRPAQKLKGKQVPGANKPIVKISFRALIVVDETVFVGVKYDGPDANFLQVIKDNWSISLEQFPKKFGFFDPDNRHGYKEENVNTTIRNGMEIEWKVLQTVEKSKKNLCIANADTFIFFERDEDNPNYIQTEGKKIETNYQNNEKTVSLFQLVNRIRHLTFTTALRLEPFPIRKKPFIMPSFPFTQPLGREIDGEVAGPGLNPSENRGRIQLPDYIKQSGYKQKSKLEIKRDDESSTSTFSKSESENNKQACTTAIALVDTPIGLTLLTFLFNFEHHRISLHSFALAALPPSSSRVMPVIDDNRVMKQRKDIRHIQQREIGSLDKIFVASGRALIVICNGQVQYHNYPYKWLNALVMTNGANWHSTVTQQPNSPSFQSSVQLSPQSSRRNVDVDSLSQSSQLSDNSRLRSDIDNAQLKIGTSMLFIISGTNSSMVVDLNTGSFFDFPGQEADMRDLCDGGGPEDFQYNPINLSNIVPIPYYSFSPYHKMDDRFALGSGNGRSGALHQIGIGHKLQIIMQGKWYQELPTLFTSRLYSVREDGIESVGQEVNVDLLTKTLAFQEAHEFIGYNGNETISWIAPTVLSEEQCYKRIKNLEQNHSTPNFSHIQKYYPSTQSLQTFNESTQQVIFEYGCITDKMIAVSYKCVVFVLIWIPAVPQITSITTDSNQQDERQTQLTNHPAIVQPVATLCFPSHIKSLTASTICTRSFLVVGCESPASIFLFRLDNIQVALQTEQTRQQLWDDGEKKLNNIKYKFIYPSIQRPNLALVIQNGIKNKVSENDLENKHVIHIGQGNDCSVICADSNTILTRGLNNQQPSGKQLRFVEVESGSGQFVEAVYSSKAVLTRLFDLFTNDIPVQILLSTFKHQVRIYSQEELEASDLNPVVGLSFLAQSSKSQQPVENEKYEIQRNYLNNEGAVVMIGGYNGQLITTIVPLSAILDFSPGQPYENKQVSTAQFFFPSPVTTMKMCSQPLKIANDEAIVYIYGDRAYALAWSNRLCKIITTDLDYNGIIHSMMPMRVVDEEPSLQFKDDDDEKNSELSDSNSQSQKGSSTHKTQVPHQSIAWIDYSNRRLIFGSIDKRRVLTREIKDLSSHPIAIAHMPTIKAIAVLCREYSQNEQTATIYAVS
ncbi:MAG: hypothetical protein EZS28_011206 [Streblomastix strix]|uniref:Uncharacterized protein n=1 Tax=Streblomastix strix TaxID=222440 RepID=A0A5J4WE69_9EUKA|nr:MAG: hypothetical protein EZS28_011206 [Streblomastix strix]